MTDPKKITPLTYRAYAHELANIEVERIAATTDNERAQLLRQLGHIDAAEAELATTRLQKLDERKASLEAAWRASQRLEEAQVEQADDTARREAVTMARPLVGKWYDAARAFADHLEGIREKIEALDAARLNLQKAIPFPGGGPFNAAEYAAIRDGAAFDRRDILHIGGVVYHSKLGEMGAFPDMNRFAPGMDIRDRVEGMSQALNATLDRLARDEQ